MNPFAQTLIRNTLQLLSGALAAHGYGTSEDWQMVVGAAMSIIVYVWGVVHQKKNQDTIKENEGVQKESHE